jgi:chromate reductase, NAD(P)H dehydrogenase (quinone)
MRILGISGSLRSGSFNSGLLRAAQESAPHGVELELYDGLADLPPYDQDVQDHDPPEAVLDLRERIAAADAVLVATPEYNGSIPGVLKNAIDWASRPFPDNALRGKPVAIVGASTGSYGTLWAQADLRRVLGIVGARVLEGELPVPKAHERFDAEGHLTDDLVRDRLAQVVERLAEEASVLLAAA